MCSSDLVPYGRAPGGDLGGGGRYDGLLGRFGRDLPAVGFSLTLDRVLPLVRDAESLALGEFPAEEHVLAAGKAAPEQVFARAWSLRGEGRRVRIEGGA